MGCKFSRQAGGRTLGDEDPHTLTVKGNLASTYWKQERFDESEELQLQVLEARKTILGDEHPDTLMSKSHLAITFYNQGLFGQAADQLLHATKASETVLGAGHPDTVRRKFLLRELHREVMLLGGWDEDFED